MTFRVHAHLKNGCHKYTLKNCQQIKLENSKRKSWGQKCIFACVYYSYPVNNSSLYLLLPAFSWWTLPFLVDTGEFKWPILSRKARCRGSTPSLSFNENLCHITVYTLQVLNVKATFMSRRMPVVYVESRGCRHVIIDWFRCNSFHNYCWQQGGLKCP